MNEVRQGNFSPVPGTHTPRTQKHALQRKGPTNNLNTALLGEPTWAHSLG